MLKTNIAEFFGEIDEIPANVCGQIADRYIIEAPIDDIVKRDFAMYNIYDINQPELNLFLVIPRNDIKQNRRNTSVHRMLRVLQVTRNRSVHFPRLILSGHLQRLVYGLDGEQAFERDPEWPHRPMAIIESDNTILGSLPCFSNNGALPVETSLQLGIGIFRAISALHRAGFVHRLVSPYSFTVATPLSPDMIQRGVTIIDFSFVIPFPIMPRVHVPFVGTMRYSSIRAHFGREQGPSDDVISLIYVIAEFISGKLPWRSVRDEQTIVIMKRDFCQSDCFRRLPRELRRLYRDMYLTPGPAIIDHNIILGDFITALSRKNPDPQNKLPTYLNTETPKIFPRKKRDRRRKSQNIETGASGAGAAIVGGDAGGGGGDAQAKSRRTTTS
uniref:Protein kinase domain-containing protein n=1 Tax=Panagrolaimus sp. ES5 TaxID=591445 RepID=A0AC34GRI3_9BILA